MNHHPLDAVDVPESRRPAGLDRRHTVLAVGGVAALLLALSPLALRDHDGEPTALTGASAPSQSRTGDDRSPAAAVDDGATPAGSAEPARNDIPAGFPLAAGWPDQSVAEPSMGLTGPGRDLAPLTLTVCGAHGPAAPSVDRLEAEWVNPEDHRRRELVTFTEVDRAAAWQQQLVRLFRDCLQDQPTANGQVARHGLARTGAGDESWAFSTWCTLESSPCLSLEVVSVVRVGRSVLVDTGYGEGGEEDVPALIDVQNQTSAAVVAAMCRYTPGGC